MSQLSFIVGQISQLNLGISLRSFFQILDLHPFYPAILRTLNSSKNCTLYKQNKKMLIKKCSIIISIQAISIIWLLQCNYSMSTSVSFILVFQPCFPYYLPLLHRFRSLWHACYLPLNIYTLMSIPL